MRRAVAIGVAALAIAALWTGSGSGAQGGRASAEGGRASAQIQNGRVETRADADVARAIAAVSPAGSAEPAWVAWQVPLVDGDRDLCGWYSDRLGTVRGFLIDERVGVDPAADPETKSRPQIAPAAGAIPLEAGTSLVVLLRVVGGQVERLRTAGDDCPMDAGGRTVYWLGDVSAAESLRFLERLVTARADGTASDLERRAADTAMRAIALHRDARADATLATLATLAAHQTDATARRQATSALVTYRGAAGVDVLLRLARSHADPGVRTEAVRALSQSRDPRVAQFLEEILRR